MSILNPAQVENTLIRLRDMAKTEPLPTDALVAEILAFLQDLDTTYAALRRCGRYEAAHTLAMIYDSLDDTLTMLTEPSN